MGEWKTKVGDTVDIGQELGTHSHRRSFVADQFQTAAKSLRRWKDCRGGCRRLQRARIAREDTPATTTSSRRFRPRSPANSAALFLPICRSTRAGTQFGRRARQRKRKWQERPLPSVMIAWAVVRAMEKHAPFRRLILEDDRIIENDDFDLGIAVALEGDRLATAVITQANKKSWPEFVKIYNETVDATRGGRVDAMNAPVVITSLGAFGVRAGAPIVVPPSVGTLFVGVSPSRTDSERKTKTKPPKSSRSRSPSITGS